MYSNDKNVAGAQKIMLDILLTVHKICTDHHLTYFLIAGTLLGAIRHGGFIPWDDDMDIAMPRKDFNKFLEIAPECLPDAMFLQTAETDPGYSHPIAKIRRTDTYYLEFHEDGTEPYNHGIYIDVFPFDYYEHEWFLRWMRWTVRVRGRRLKYRKGTLKRFLMTIWTHYILFVPIELSSLAREYFRRHKEYFANDRAAFMTNGLDWPNNRLTRTRDILPVKFAEGIFEGHGFYLPADPDAYLRVNFGPDYMQLPPEDKRKTHARLIRFGS